MPNCSKCEQPLAPEMKFCRHCGTPAPTPTATAISCPNCGKDNEVAARFCKGCGTPLPATRQTNSLAEAAAMTAPPPAQQPCPSCGRSNAVGTRFCKGCGAPMQTGPGPESVSQPGHCDSQETAAPDSATPDSPPTGGRPQTPEPSRAAGVVKALVIVLVLAGIAIGSFFFFRSQQQPVLTDAAANSTGATPAAQASEGQAPMGADAAKPSLDKEQNAKALATEQEAPAAAEKAAKGSQETESSKTAAEKAKASTEPKKRRAEKKAVQDSGPAAAKQTPGQLENDILEQLRKKKQALGVE